MTSTGTTPRTDAVRAATPVLPAEEPLDPQLQARWLKIQAAFQTHAHLLCAQGSVARGQKHGQPIWSVRFWERRPEGPPVQRAIYIGPDLELLRRTRQLLDWYREPKKWAREIVLLTKLAARSAELVRRVVRRRASPPGGAIPRPDRVHTANVDTV